jgi:cysteine synthase B
MSQDLEKASRASADAPSRTIPAGEVSCARKAHKAPSRTIPAGGQPLPPVGRELLSLIGNTPLLALPRIERGVPGVALLAKAEWFNPGGSVKDRAAMSIIADAQARGQITPGKRLLDASSGNTAVAYAMIARAKGYPVTLCVPRNANPQVRSILRPYGAELVGRTASRDSDGRRQEVRVYNVYLCCRESERARRGTLYRI